MLPQCFKTVSVKRALILFYHKKRTKSQHDKIKDLSKDNHKQ